MFAAIAGHYTATLERHGPTPRGADWESLAAQQLRFVQLLKLCDFREPFSLNDVGCGYGALLDFLAQFHPGVMVDYAGTDLSAPMIAAAKVLWAEAPQRRFAHQANCLRMADYSVASGIFNVQRDCRQADWEDFIAATLRDMRAHSRLGFAANFIAHDAPSVDGLYRAPEDKWQTYCQTTLGCPIDTICGYGMREFTLLARCC